MFVVEVIILFAPEAGSPKFHIQEVVFEQLFPNPNTEVLVNSTFVPLHTGEGAVKFGLGFIIVVILLTVETVVPQGLDIVNVTVNPVELVELVEQEEELYTCETG